MSIQLGPTLLRLAFLAGLFATESGCGSSKNEDCEKFTAITKRGRATAAKVDAKDPDALIAAAKELVQQRDDLSGIKFKGDRDDKLARLEVAYLGALNPLSDAANDLGLTLKASASATKGAVSGEPVANIRTSIDDSSKALAKAADDVDTFCAAK